MSEHIQDPPNCIQIEFTEGCNLRCDFCGIQGIRGKKREFKFMTPEIARTLAYRIEATGWNCRLEFAMRGEPTLNPDFEEIVRIFRMALPDQHMLLTTNGKHLLKKDREGHPTVWAGAQLFDVVAIDCYEHSREIWEPIHDMLTEDNVSFSWYPDVKEANPHRRRTGVWRARGEIVLVRDISQQTQGTHASLSNHCGSGSPLDYSKTSSRCTLPFREISVRFNGDIALCCNDWRGEYFCGNIREASLNEIWQGPEFDAARREIYHNGRTFRPCEGCNYRATRVGLLPDKLGKKNMPEPDAGTQDVITQVTSAAPRTTPVQRPWE